MSTAGASTADSSATGSSTATSSTAAENPAAGNPAAGSAATGNSYEAWKESLKQAEAAGGADWNEASEPTTSNSLGAMELKGLGTGVLLGVGFLIASVCILLLNFKYFTQGERTVGIVVGYKDFYNRRSANVYAPVVNYSAPGGVYKTMGGLSVPRSFYRIDSEVPVLYLRSDPSSAVVADFVQMFMIPTIVGSVGLICLTGTISIMLWTVRRC